MRVRVQKRGNSLALRIPKSFATETSIKVGSTVNLSLHDGKLVIEPLLPKTYDFKDLLSRVKESNIHKETFSDAPAGRELW